MQTTTIQISTNVQQKLEKMKIYARESYNEIIERMMEDEMEINEQTKKDIAEARKGKSVSHEEVKRRFGV